jgi:hypothetical protein
MKINFRATKAFAAVTSGFKLKINFKKGYEHIAVVNVDPRDSESDFTDSDIENIINRKRTVAEVASDDSDFTDSEIDINPVPRKKKALPRKKKTTTPALSPPPPANEIVLVQPTMKRKDRIVDPRKPEDAALVAAATKAGTDIYDSDADLPNAELKGVKKRDLFRNVAWGPAARDFADDGSFPVNPEFTQFVPGRWERLLDGSVADQKRKLLVKLTDKNGEKRIFANPPPTDWANQEAITILNKRTVQQIRRNTETRFREVVVPYVLEERRWIAANLQHGKPAGTWDRFVTAFNGQFEGRVVAGSSEPRPARTMSSLCKEVERFGAHYGKGLVPGRQ